MFEKWDHEQTTVNPCLFPLDVRKAEMSSYLRKQADTLQKYFRTRSIRAGSH